MATRHKELGDRVASVRSNLADWMREVQESRGKGEVVVLIADIAKIFADNDLTNTVSPKIQKFKNMIRDMVETLNAFDGKVQWAQQASSSAGVASPPPPVCCLTDCLLVAPAQLAV